jgi:hypothetical protein
MEPEYVLGNRQILERMEQEKPLVPFCGQTVDFLDKLSKLLMKSRNGKEYPDLITFAFWCRKASVMEMKKRILWLEQAEEKGVFGLGTAFHIAPSNVAMNFAYSFAAALLAGNSNIVRLPSKSFPQIACLCEAMEPVLEEFPEFKNRICFVRYGHEKEITDGLSAVSDIRIIWGGDRTIQEIQKSPLKIRGKEIVFADRYSMAVIDAADYLLLTEEQKRQKAAEFYNDTYLMDQNACTSPMLLVWLGSKDNLPKAQVEFWRHSFEVVSKKYELQAVQAVKKLQAAYRLAAAVEGAVLVKDVEQADNRLVRVKVPELSPEIMNYRENSGFFMEYETDRLEDILPVCANRCQTISYVGERIEKELREIVKQNRPFGVDRIVPVGKTMEFSLIWDGYDLIREMSREIS